VELRNHYKALGVDHDASSEEIKRAFRREALRWHPDRNPDDREAERRFKAAKDAYDVLRDPHLRRVHDDELRGGPVEAVFGIHGNGQRRPRGRCGRRCGGGFRRRWTERRRRIRAHGAVHELRIDPVDAALGCTRTIVIESVAGSCAMEVRLPAGLEEGDVVTLGESAIEVGGFAVEDIRLRVSIGWDAQGRR
jgi:molecular chaperone DnaJ